ncbi:Gfo/Idh/MocA family protein [Cohnella hashimotonis]|uniref:Gfo/Idh/MocA family oxidoreductase n=1 Tax=Cohnella hashimotonis TaxID=2826895 RepID=A0ABT6TL25_9BACL|nr:Gfo/Idh/MocA family oxidoreductase [Cohnella hashimotonis]MDI4647435.1 Gfo/Idh/MocA family oxidoreductase [Cohnella hashimotonis]
MIRIGMLSYWHVHAEDYTKQVLSHPNTEIAAIWDELPDRGAEKAAKYGVPFIANLDELLARDDIDAVVVDAPTNMHRDVMVKAARAGKHIFTEKVVATTVSEANEIAAAVRDAGVKLAVSLPRLYDGYTQSILEVIASGKLGKLTLARVRLSHNGSTANWLPAHFYSKEQCGGGALIDLGCHPVYLVRKFLGLPESVSATFGFVSGREVEDNAVAVFAYSDGAVGIAEAGFVNSHSPFSIELHGTDGTLLYGFPEEKILVRSTQDSEKVWTEVPVGDRLPFAFEQWVGHIEAGTEATENIEYALDLTRIMEAANRAAAEGKSVRLSDLEG